MEKEEAKDKALPEDYLANTEGEPTIRRIEFHQLPVTSTAPSKKKISAAFLEVDLKLAAELGRVSIKIKDLIDLGEGSLLRLNRLADESVLLLVNEVPFAHGEIVVINEHFGVRITSFLHEQKE